MPDTGQILSHLAGNKIPHNDSPRASSKLPVLQCGSMYYFT